ncbi:MAG TPA: PIN domain-containing protein [Verrucomicrobiae bacterium]|nr:PIN domain-containing protein [Verrucomicrobiae bacterium]
MKELTLVIDANILVSAYSIAGPVQDRWKSGLMPHRLVISPEIFAEVERNLRQAEFHLQAEEIRACLKDILDRCVVVRPKERYEGKMPDEKDRHVVSLAREVHADRIITGDAGLRAVSPIEGIHILKLNEFDPLPV